MNFALLSKYRKKPGLFLKIFSSLYKSESGYILTVFTFVSGFLFSEAASQFKTTAIFLLIISFILQLKIKNLFVSFFLTTLYLLQFSLPSKIYFVIVIPSYKLLTNPRQDYLLGYGITLSNIFLLLSLVVFFREIFFDKNKLKSVLKIIRYPIIFISLLSGISFLLWGLIASSLYSPFPELSIVWLLQYSQAFLLAFFIFYTYVVHQAKFNKTFTILLFTVFLQSVISFAQFIRQSSLGLTIEASQATSAYYTNVDEAQNTFRVAGTFHYHNQLALIILILISSISPVILKEKKLYLFLAFLLGLITIVLTQSRSVWLALILYAFYLLTFYKKELSKVKNSIGKRRIFLLTLTVVAGLSYIVIPRLLLSIYLFSENAGVSVRIKMISEALQAINLNPFIGYGVGTNEYTLVTLFPEGITAIFPSAIHMAYLQLFLEVGLLGSLFFFLPFILILRTFLTTKVQKSENQIKNHKFLYLSGLTVFLVYYLFQPHVGIVEFAYLGIILGFGFVGVYLTQTSKIKEYE